MEVASNENVSFWHQLVTHVKQCSKIDWRFAYSILGTPDNLMTQHFDLQSLVGEHVVCCSRKMFCCVNIDLSIKREQ